MTSLQIKRCASGSCFKDGTMHCGKCKVTFYCSKACQKDHCTKHKKHCSAHQPMPEGTFEFLKLNRDTRDKVYEDLLVARYTPEQQAEHDSLTNAFGDRLRIRNALDPLEERLMISPGMPLWGVKGYQPLVNARGPLNANKQINEELTSTLFSKNTFWYKIDPSSLAQIKRLVINALKHNFNHIVKSLNMLGDTLESLMIRINSCFHGRVEEMRAEIDSLLIQPTARPVQVMREDNTVFTFTHNNVRKFYTSGFDLCDAFEKLNITVKNFQVYGDLPGEVIRRLNRKFAVAAGAKTSSDTNNNDSGPLPDTSVPVPISASFDSSPSAHNLVGKAGNELVDLIKRMADKHPNDKKMAELAHQFLAFLSKLRGEC
ncbi:hypothetical protein QM012_008500 [Aureobasidium pullulans]|uniref:MYND-type domain-containing protein n=1 Tax=Aureobasidium pullulans TaxID=5580 RepID=A0ABR0TJK8_AURPU